MGGKGGEGGRGGGRVENKKKIIYIINFFNVESKIKEMRRMIR